jgi:hypothetical protein
MADRFQLETDITNIYNTADDLDLLVERILEKEDVDIDEIANALIGVSVMTRMRVEKAFDTFKAVFHLDGCVSTEACE